MIVSIYVERDSQKPIIIGKGAEHLVRVKKKLRTPVNRIVGQKPNSICMSRLPRMAVGS